MGKFKDNVKAAQYQLLPIDSIIPDPDQPRKRFEIAQLTDSVRESGIIEPILVRPANAEGKHMIIVGERRWRACLKLEAVEIPAIIRDVDADDAMVVQLFENIGGVRMDIDIQERSALLTRIVSKYDTQEAAAKALGVKTSWLSHNLAMSELRPEIGKLYQDGKIDSVAAVSLNKLSEKHCDAADELIHRAQDGGSRLTRDVMRAELAKFGLVKKRASKKDAVAGADGAASETPSSASEGAVLSSAASLAPGTQLSGAAPDSPSPQKRKRSVKVKRAIEMLGLADDVDDGVLMEKLAEELLKAKMAVEF